MACADKNPLIHEGVDRLNRRLEALSPTFAKVDERTMEDLMLFAKRYAGFLKYKNADNQDDGTWQTLMKQDISLVLAVLLSLDVLYISDYIKILYKRTRHAISEDNTAEARKQFKFLFDLIYTLVKTVDEQCSLLNPEPDYQQTLKTIIQSKIKTPFSKLVNFREANLTLQSTSNKTDSGAPVLTVNSREVLILDSFELTAEVLKITIPDSPVTEKISHVINHNLFNAQITLLLGGISTILKNAQELLEKSLTAYPKHEPHYGLFLTFLKLFREAQESLNSYTKRHLDFYYKEVLRLQNKRPQPDKTHLVLELQKHISQHQLPKGTLFKGGKDVTGKEMHYATKDDVVFNQAIVHELKAFQITKKNLLASSVVNSADGEGEEIESSDKSWFAFGDPKKKPTEQAGFAIASNLCFLKEGKRKISVSITFQDPLTSKTTGLKHATYLNKIRFNIKLSGEEDWVTKNIDATYVHKSKVLNFQINLEVDEEAIVPYDESIHQKNLQTKLPVLLAYLDQEKSNVWYADIMNNPVSSIKVTVDVQGAKDLALSSDGGSIDAAKPFKPFGDFPKKGAGFYIGSKEIFQKKLDLLRLNFPVSVPFNVQYLYGNAWGDYPKEKEAGTPNYLIKKNSSGNLLQPSSVDFTPNELIKATSFEGYLRLRLDSSAFSLAAFMEQINKSLDNVTLDTQQGNFVMSKIVENSAGGTVKKSAASSTKTTLEFMGLESVSEGIDKFKLAENLELQNNLIGKISIKGNSIPVPPEIISESFSIDYIASENIPLSETGNNRHTFYHLTPFGYYQPITSPDTTLIPQFAQEGELLIGISKASAPTTINLLFLLVEGSSNPLKTQEEVNWSFMDKQNSWRKFENNQVIDGSINLTRSGIVTVTLPKEAGSEHTALSTGLYWIKASVAGNTDAVCKIIDVRAQAALVELVQNEAEDMVFRQVLPAESISKLKNSDSAVKSIEQPADSFNGLTLEKDEDYYLRVSERLRHKQRAVSIWDYEHLVLQEFPAVHKVKCLNHSGFYEDKGEKIFCEAFPGHVTVICIPDLKLKTHVNHLRPYTPVGLLTDIQLFLEKIKNPFAKLHVVNPRFEEIQLDFEVKFHEHMDETFYRNLLDLEIERFLCPWAFDSQHTLSFGGKIPKSSLINFVEERPYVDFVSCFKMHHIIRNEVGGVKSKMHDLEEVVAGSSRSVLVSHLEESADIAIRHIIQVIQKCDC